MAATVNTIWYMNAGNGTSTGYYALTKWAANTAYTVGLIRRQNATPTINNERCFICIVAGTSNAVTEPTWVLTQGAKTTEAGGVVWQECTGKAAVNGDATNVPLSSGQRSQSVALGSIIQNNAGTFLFICTTAGTAGAGEPTYNTTTGNTTTDSGVTWTCIGAGGSFSAWAAPAARITGGMWNAAAGNDTVYFSAISAESTTGSLALPGSSGSANFTRMICVAQAGSIPPTGADVTTGASVTSTSGSFQNSQGRYYINGIVFNQNASANLMFGNTADDIFIFENCALNMAVSGTTGQLYLGHAGNTSLISLTNTTIEINNSASSYIATNGNFIWRDTPTALSKPATGSWPTTLFQPGNGGSAGSPLHLIEGVDLSAYAGTQYFGTSFIGRAVLNKCKLGSTPAVLTVTALNNGPNSGVVDVIDCDTGTSTYRHERYAYSGSHTTSASATFTGGASNGTTSYSWRLTTSAVAQWLIPLETLPMAIWNTVTGADVVITLNGLYNGTALPNNDDIWFDVDYFGTASVTTGTRKTCGKANVVATGSALTANTGAAWNSTATARGNTTAYVLNDLISVASAGAGQLYICTTAGTSSGSVPGGYASNSDGSSVTDGTAVFRAMMRFKMTVTLTSPQPQSAGYLNCYVKAAKASSTFFVDPLPVLS